MGTITIQEVAEKDAGFLFQLMNDPLVIQALNEVPTTQHDWEEAILLWQSDSDEEGYIIFENEKPIGWFALNNLMAENNEVFLKMAALLPEYQNKGIGAYVITQLIGKAQEKNAASLSLFTDQDNHRAQKCYMKCGFHSIGTFIDEMSNGKRVTRIKMTLTL